MHKKIFFFSYLLLLIHLQYRVSEKTRYNDRKRLPFHNDTPANSRTLKREQKLLIRNFHEILE